MESIGLSRKKLAHSHAIALVRSDNPKYNGLLAQIAVFPAADTFKPGEVAPHEPDTHPSKSSLKNVLKRADTQRAIDLGVPRSTVHPRMIQGYDAMQKARRVQDEVATGTIDGGADYELPIGARFEVMPNADPEARQCIMIAGASGSGKSFWCAMYIRLYLSMYPDRTFYLVSMIDKDPVLDELRPVRVPADALLKDITTASVAKSIILFDDVDSFTGAHDKAVHALMDKILTMGRHSGTTILVSTHYLTNYKKTRIMLNECDTYVVFPRATAHAPLSGLMKRYFGLTDMEVRDLRRTAGRWAALYKNYPQYMVSETKVTLLLRDDDVGVKKPRRAAKPAV